MPKNNYDKIFTEIVESLPERKSLLLHACCAPCSSSVLERVTPYFSVTLFYYNPNITERGEYEKRLAELRRFVSHVYGDTITILDGGYSPELFFERSKGLEGEKEGGARCKICYRERLSKTAEVAKNGGFDYFCTTLSVSPFKDAESLNAIGRDLEKIYGVDYLYSDFKKRQGYVRSIELSKEYGLYRQNYCGCVFSEEEALQKRGYKPVNE